MNKKFTRLAIAGLLCFLFPFAGMAQVDNPHQGNQIDLSLKLTPEQESNLAQDPTPESLERFFDRYGISSRIVGGEPVDILDYPWQVSLQLQPQFGGGHFCGGTIINDEWILTASHCLIWEDVDLQPQHIRIRAGFTLLNSTLGSYYNVAEFILHPDYNDDSNQNDIALIRLTSPIDLSHPAKNAVKVVTQADAAAGMTDPGVMAKISGWGSLTFQGPVVNELRAAEVPIVDVSQTSYPPSMITADMIMAGVAGVDACQGDSGGPMVVPDGFGGYKIAGVVSWGNGCGLPGYPGVYARVSHFEDWIGQYVVIADPNQYTNVWFEGFEPALTGGALPEGWQVKRNTAADGGLNGNNLLDVTTVVPRRWFRISQLAYPYSSGTAAQFVRSGEAAMHIYWDTQDFTWAITPEIQLPVDAEDLQLSFWPWMNSDITQNYITQLYVNILVDEQWETIASLDDGTINMFSSSVEIALADYLGETVKFAFVHKWNDGIQMSIDDIAIRYENPQATAIFSVSDGVNPLSGAAVDITGVGLFTTGEDGRVSVDVYLGPNAYEFTVARPGYYPYNGSVEITADNQLVEIELEKIPAPEISVSPQSIELEVYQGFQASTALEIANPGDADLTWNLFAIPAVKHEKVAEVPSGSPVVYEGIVANGTFRAYQDPDYVAEESGRLFEQVEIHHDSGPGSNSVGTNSAANWISAARFTPEDLALYYGLYELSAVRFHIRYNTFSSVTAKVWKGGTENGPAEEIYSAVVTSEVVIDGFTNHELPEPIALEAGYEYWIGYQIAATGSYPSTVDVGPMVPGKGAWMFFNNAWQLLPDIAPSLNYNWVIRGVLDPLLGVDWLSFEPDAGTVEPDQEATPLVVIDASDLELGDYQANIVVRSNAGDDILVPVTISVVPPVFDVEFLVVNPDGEPVEEAVISLNGLTNAAGDYLFADVIAGTYAFTIQKEGYFDANGSVMVVDQDVMITIMLIPEDATTYALDINIDDEFGNPVEGAYLVLENFGGYFTDSQGSISLQVVAGAYDFFVSKYGFAPQSGQVSIVDADFDLDITMTYLRYMVSISADPETGGTAMGAGEYYHGQTVTITAQAADYHTFVNWTEADEVISENEAYTFEITGPRSFTAHFQINTYQLVVTAEPTAGGSVAGSGVFEHGTLVVVTAVPAASYVFVHWTEAGEVIEDAGATYSFNIESDRNLVAVFNLVTHTLTILKTGEGITDPEVGEHVYPHGTSVTLTATNDGMWVFQHWTVGSQNIPSNVFNVTMNSDQTVHAYFQDVTSVDEPETLAGFTVYPNPASGKFFLKLNRGFGTGQLRVIDAAGNVVFVRTLESIGASQTIELDASTWTRGIYFVSLTSEHGVQTTSVVISR
ncbi:MAG: trypsin-like serine protease [Bacteroidales bacterium]|nr:trypsin-like serine protease [Bacteroidales bacterium]